MTGQTSSPYESPPATGFSVISPPDLERANSRYRPVRNTSAAREAGVPDTRVKITSAADQGIELVATFNPQEDVDDGVNRVAGKQIVNTTVYIDFGQVLPIWWMASALRLGDISPNVSYFPYSGDDDDFEMKLNHQITVGHTASEGWDIPPFDSREYEVDVGFGVGTEYIAWGYSAPCQPNKRLALDASAYELVRSEGQSRIGDPVTPNPDNEWEMSIGLSYLLSFDNCGVGTLTPA